MTDVIIETRIGRIHQHIPDGRNEVVYIRPSGTMKVRRMPPTYIGEQIENIIRG